MRQVVMAVILVGIFAWWNATNAEMTSPNYIIRWDTISTGGSDTSASASYGVRDTLGNTSIGGSDSSSYQVQAGYRQGVFDQVLTFDVLSEAVATGRAATGLSGTTISASTSGLAVGEMIALVQDLGASQVSAIGRIIALGGGSITVDSLTDAGVAPVIDGTDDYVYRLNGAALGIGQLDPAAVSTGIVSLEVSADVDGGYNVQVFDDGDLRDGANDIDDVADGSVTAGDEEYGGRSSDSTLGSSTFDTADTAFTTSFQTVADENTNVFDDRHFVTVKVAMSPATPDGTYANVLSFIVSGNF